MLCYICNAILFLLKNVSPWTSQLPVGLPRSWVAASRTGARLLLPAPLSILRITLFQLSEYKHESSVLSSLLKNTRRIVYNFTFMWPCVVTNFLIIKLTRCTNLSNLFWKWNSSCFGYFLCPSSRVIHCRLHSAMVYVVQICRQLSSSRIRMEPVPSWFCCSKAVCMT
jgi:hypothetical protein